MAEDTRAYDALREDHVRTLLEMAPEHIARIHWTREQIEAERLAALRRTLKNAKENSPWYRDRLAGIDPDAATEADLKKIPVMTKHDVMENFDRIVTDKRLTLPLINEYLEKIGADGYLFDRYHAVATGGTSGFRGVFVYDWDSWALMALSARDFLISFLASNLPSGTAAFVFTDKGYHLSSALSHTFSLSPDDVWIPAVTPMDEMVERLNAAQPIRMLSYASMLYMLALEAKAGRLAIKPKWIGTAGEAVFPALKSLAYDVWGLQVINEYMGSEGGGYAWSCGFGRGMHINEDLQIIEPVDAKGDPVPPGTKATKLYLTNLFNMVMPLIRYEVTDEITMLKEACECGVVYRKLDDVKGRMDDMFQYESGVVVHPLVFRSVFVHHPRVIEYQVRQTQKGAEVLLVGAGPLDSMKIRRELEDALARSGLANPEVSVVITGSIERTLVGKLKRFIPLKNIALQPADLKASPP